MTQFLTHFPLWWYYHSLKWWLRFFKNLLTFLNQQLALSLMAGMMLTPLWHDTSILGRILSLVFRIIRVVSGTVLLTVTVLAMCFWLIVWLLIPPALILMFKLPGLIFLALIWIVDILRQMNRPHPLTTPPATGQEPKFFTHRLKKLVADTKQQPESFKLKLLQLPSIKNLLERLEVSNIALAQTPAPITWDQWVRLATLEALAWKDSHINPSHFLASWLKLSGIKEEFLPRTVNWLKHQKLWSRVPFLWDADYQDRPMGGINRDLTGTPTPTLDKYSTDLTKLAVKKQLPEMFGKELILNQLSQVLSQDQQNNALVVGPPGSGKSTLIKSLAQEIVRGVKYQKLKFKRLISLDVATLSAGADSAVLNDRITKIIAEIKAAGNIILFVDEVHNLASINQDRPETADVMIALEPVLSEGLFQFVGATTTSQYKKFIEPNEAFSRLFTLIEITQATPSQTLDLLTYLAFVKENKSKLTITLPALQRIVDVCGLYIHDRVLPDQAVQLLDEVVAAAQTQNQKLVTAAAVDTLIELKTKIPVGPASTEEKKRLLQLETVLHEQVVGQEKALKAVSDAMRRLRTKLKPVGKPIASFLFAGPTGVGKTETAKALATQFFGTTNLMVRLDMSEYQHTDSLNRLIGSPPGSRDYLAGGQLTEAVRHQPYTVVLLDEMEKADPKILNLFLQVLDEGRLTDSQGKLVDFTNTIIIATSNVGTKESADESRVKEAIEAHFPREFLNRFTDIIIFSPLTLSQTEQVVALKLNQLSARLKQQEIDISFKPEMATYLAKEGFSGKWGGRQIDRVIETRVANLISRKLLEGNINAGQQLTMGVNDLG